MSFLIPSSLSSVLWTIISLFGLFVLFFYFKYLKAPYHSVKEPPLIPYKWPYIGALFEFLEDQRAFYARARRVSFSLPLDEANTAYSKQSKGEPFTIFLNNANNYIFSKPKDVELLYRTFTNRNHSQDDVKQFRVNILGFDSKDADMMPGLRVDENKVHAKYLLDQLSMEKMTASFYSRLSYQLTELDHDIDRLENPEMVGFHFVGDPLVQATVATFFGHDAFGSYPYLFKDFRTFFTVGLGYRLFGAPLIFDRSPLHIMERIKACLRRVIIPLVKEDEFPNFRQTSHVSKYNQERILGASESGLTTEGIVCNEFDIIIAGNINTIPISYIALLHLYLDQDLLANIRKEVEGTHYEELSSEDRAQLDSKSLPRLYAFVREVMRFHSTSQSVRELKKDQSITFPSEIEGGEKRICELKKGNQLPGFLGWFVHNNTVVMPSSLIHHNPDIHYDPEVFDADRFLSVENGGKGIPITSGNFRPFGGGSSYCPGRYFALNQVVGYLALVSMRFDIEIISKNWKIPRNSDFYYVTASPDINLKIGQRRHQERDGK